MKIRLLYLLALIVCLTGCLDKETEEEDAKDVCQLLSSTTTIKNHQGASFNYSLTYSYDDQGNLIQIAAPDTSMLNIKLEYDAQNRLIRERSGSYSWTSEYNTAGQVTKQTRTFAFAPDRYETFYLLHAYDSENNIIKSEYYAAESGGDVLLYTYRYTYSDGKVNGIEMLSEQDTRHYTATLVTDAKKAQLPALPMHMLYMFRDETIPAIGLLNGNVTNYNVQHGEGESGFKTFAADITYNASGYPTAVTRNYASGATENTTYSYSCK